MQKWDISNVLFLHLDIEKLCTFSQRFPLPSMYRALVWKVLLGMRPRSRAASFQMYRMGHLIDTEGTFAQTLG